MSSRPTPQAGDRLESTLAAQAKQKSWFAEFRRGVMEERQPYVIADAVTPHEIFHAMDIPVVAVPWYSSVIAAKKLSPHYFDYMESLGFHRGLPKYTSLPYFATLENDPQRAPYGGLPRPMLLLDRLRGDYTQRITEQWARAFDVPTFMLEASSARTLEPGWYERGQTDWEAFYGTARMDFQVQQLQALIRVAETLSGRTLGQARFLQEMQRINEAAEIVADVRNLLARTRPAPIPLTEQLGNIMAATWHRGSEWAVEHLRRYRDEVKSRIAAGAAACPDERIRLLWLNNGLWFNTGFYRAFEARYGAVFVWSMYSDFLNAGYRKVLGPDPLRALAARHISMNEQLHLPPWMADWIIHQARDFGADGAVMLVPTGDRMSSYGTRMARLALEMAGIPVLELHASMVDERLWDEPAMTALVSTFIEERVAPRSTS